MTARCSGLRHEMALQIVVSFLPFHTVQPQVVIQEGMSENCGRACGVSLWGTLPEYVKHIILCRFGRRPRICRKKIGFVLFSISVVFLYFLLRSSHLHGRHCRKAIPPPIYPPRAVFFILFHFMSCSTSRVALHRIFYTTLTVPHCTAPRHIFLHYAALHCFALRQLTAHVPTRPFI